MRRERADGERVRDETWRRVRGGGAMRRDTEESVEEDDEDNWGWMKRRDARRRCGEGRW